MINSLDIKKPVYVNGILVGFLYMQPQSFAILAQEESGFALIPRINKKSATARVNGFDMYQYEEPCLVQDSAGHWVKPEESGDE